MSIIGARTNLGKGSLYNFFPGGKQEMATAALAEIERWFETYVFQPLRSEPDARRAVSTTSIAIERYFRSGRRVCLVGAFALDGTRDLFSEEVRGYFVRWLNAMIESLVRGGRSPSEARGLAEDYLSSVQGALVMARAMDDPGMFKRVLERSIIRALDGL